MRPVYWFSLVVLCALAGFAGYGWGREWPSGGGGSPVEIPVDVAAYEARLEALTIDRDGWRARFEGVVSVMPDTVYRVDTLVLPPDTVLRFVSVDSRGRLSVELLTTPSNFAQDSASAPDLPGGMQPELRTGYDVSECDEGFSLEGGTVACDRSRLGHLYVGVEASRHPSLTAWWVPSYRSPWSAGISFDGERWDGYVRRGLRLW